jgi:outer membrane protein assembly factor BamB
MGRIVRALAVSAVALLAAGCWPVPGQNPDRTGYNPFETEISVLTVEDLHEVWRWTGSGAIGGPVTSAGGVHVLDGCRAVALDAGTGSVRWQVPFTDPTIPCAGPLWVQPSEPHVTADGQKVLGSVMGGSVRPPGLLQVGFLTRAWDVGSGTSSEVPNPTSFVLAERGTRVVSFAEGQSSPFVTRKALSLVDLATGTVRGIPLSLQPSSVPVGIPQVTLGSEALFHAGPGILATQPGDGTTGYGVRAFSVDEPRPGCGPISLTLPGFPPPSMEVECPQWATQVDGAPTAPVRSPDQTTLYVRTNAGTLYALDAATGDVLWTGTGLGDAGSPAYANEMVYVPTGDGRIVAFVADGCGEPTCIPYWSYQTGATGPMSTPVVGGPLLYATAGGTAYAFEAGGCRSMLCSPLWSGPGSGSPVVSNGRLYVRSPEGTGLVAYGVD